MFVFPVSSSYFLHIQRAKNESTARSKITMLNNNYEVLSSQITSLSLIRKAYHQNLIKLSFESFILGKVFYVKSRWWK